VAIQYLKTGTTVGHRYRIERLLGQGGLGQVYLAQDLLGGNAQIALKILASRDGNKASNDSIRDEFSFLSRLRHPNLVRILEFGVLKDRDVPFLAEEYIEGQELFQASADWSIERKVAFLAALCRVVHYLHSRGIIHRDLKPSNILVPAGGNEIESMKVLDFGLAQWSGKGRQHNGVGTLAYAAPEILLGQQATNRSDLYSIGILFYQLLTRHLPFEDDDPGFLVQKHLQGRPDLRSVERLEYGASLVQALRSLLEKDPEKRPSSAEDTVRLLSVATGQDFSPETPQAVESYFSAGKFVGRQRELSLLQQRAVQVRESGRGCSIFVTGEGGVGKSRILEELRIWALLEGWRVIEARCQQTDDRSYAPFREILAKTEKVSDATPYPSRGEEEFRFQEMPKVAEGAALELSTESAAGQFRDLLTREVVRRLAGSPTILLLHDLHWGDEATIAVLDYLSSDISAHPVLLCVSLRPGESRDRPLGRLMDQAARQLRGETLALETLSEESVVDLVSSMIGEGELGKKIGAWVYRASGGNPFFLEQILKHLVDRELLKRDQGNWRLEPERLESFEMPESIASVLRHRIDQLSPVARDLAQWLAVFQRAVPTEFLKHLAHQESKPLDAGLAELASRQVIHIVTDNGVECYEFWHGLIAEVIYRELPEKRRRQMHRRIAEMLESEYGVEGHLREIALHLIRTGGGEKALPYALKAAAACKSEFASELALTFYEFVLRRRDALTPEQICETVIDAADAYCALGTPKKAIRLLEGELLHQKGQSQSESAARLYAKLSRSYQCLGDPIQTEKAALRGLDLIGTCAPSPQRANTEASLLIQLAYRPIMQSRPRNGLMYLRRALNAVMKVETNPLVGHIFSSMAAVNWIACELHEGIRSSMKAIDILKPLNASHLLPVAYSHLAMNLTALGRFGVAFGIHERAVSMSKTTRSLFLQIQSMCNLAECYSRSGSLEHSLQISQEVVGIAEETENRALIWAARVAVIEVSIAKGDYSLAYRTLSDLTIRDEKALPIYTNAQVCLWSAWFYVELGDAKAALSELGKLKKVASSEAPVYEADLGEILRARAYGQQGRLDDALRLLKQVNQAVTKKRWPYQMCLVRLQLGEVLADSGDFKLASKYARDALRLAKAMPSLHLEAQGHIILSRIQSSCAVPSRTETSVVRADYNSALMGARLELETAVRLAETSKAEETIWRAYSELARVEELVGNKDASLAYSHKVVEHLSRVERSVPAERLSQFRQVPERLRARLDCEKRISEHQSTERRLGGLAVGEMEERQLRILYRVSCVINSIRELDPLLEAAIDLLIQAAGMDRALIFLKNDSTGKLEFVKGRNLKRETLARAERISHGILEEVSRQGKPFVSANAVSDLRVAERESVHAHQLGTLFCAPLKSGGRILGTLYADHSAAAGALEESTISLFAAFCNLTAIAIENARAHRQLVDEKTELEEHLRQAREGYTEFLGRSAIIEKLRERIALVAASPMDVLVSGESGTGKELVARALHRTGRRASAAFIPLDCGSLSDTLVESELFGYRKGAFTGALENRVGLLEAANGGVVFLDEISNLSLKLQGKLLRVLQEREVRRLGETLTRKIDVRVVAATNRDLREAVRRGRFRKDLYYRLNAMEIRVPPLRERPEDIPLLLQWFLNRTAEAEGGRVKVFSPEASARLSLYGYPGNVRQLKNIVLSSYYLAPGRIIEMDHLPPEVRDGQQDPAGELQVEGGSHQLYRQILQGEGTFDDLVKKPFLERRINSATVRKILHRALTETRGRYRDAFRLLKVRDGDYSVTMAFLKRQGCYLDFRPYRKAHRARAGASSLKDV
jgi:Nif-specific regulatory protein